MNFPSLNKQFYHLVAPDIPNDWEVEELLEPYLDQSDEVCREVFKCIPAIWPISNSLCCDFLRIIPETLKILPLSQLSTWVGEILDRYELDGLRAAQRFMRDVESGYMNQSKAGMVLLGEVEGRLLTFIRGVAGRDLSIAPGSTVFTDTETIFLLPELAVFSASADNILLYKLILAFQWAYIANGTFTIPDPVAQEALVDSEPSLWLNTFFASFAQPLFARDCYFLLETVRAARFLEQELPGLMRAWAKLPCIITLPGEENETISPQAAVLRDLQSRFLDRSLLEVSREAPLPILREYWHRLFGEGVSAMDTVSAVMVICAAYATNEDEEQEYEGITPLLFQGEIRLSAVEAVHHQRFLRQGEELVHGLALHLASLPQEQLEQLLHSEEEKENGSTGLESDVTMIMDSEFAGTVAEPQAPLLITINNEEVQLSEELAEQMRQFHNEFGHLPGRFLSSAVGQAGEGRAPDAHPGQEQGEELQAPICYDEWDYRRKGFRKNWCILTIKEVPALRTGFIRQTLGKYHGVVNRLRHQFEMMRTSDRFARRQRDGDDIDLDALVESLADGRAGLPSSDRLFIKLLRDERDIAVVFLVDMSNSTAGWVGNAIKESLVLMTEALEVLGDRYAVYGFSGMRRTRCELFHIKEFGEPYGERVRERIGAISPMEYTRMGPAIRHATSLLTKTEARVRLLITLTDGKPEDYDDYKGEYAIEDTRHALLEAKMAGVHPFCITIDHQAHDYMDHLYGPVNYIFVTGVWSFSQQHD
ncbi:MAG: VWA domain-containing protein [Pseudomonadota bacterium]